MNYPKKKNKCLLLNADYSPLTLVSWKKSIVWAFRGSEDRSYGIEILHYSDNYVFDSNQKKHLIPTVARSKYFFNVYKRDIAFSRRNLFIRDNYTCQYCGNIFCFSQLTYDHIIPKSRYKPNVKNSTNWHNVVTSCLKCNNTKGNKTPEEAGMKLKSSPYQPKYAEKYLRWYADYAIIANEAPDEWKEFIKHEPYFSATN